MAKGAQHVFGPVPSRRLGLSLGLDVTPMKTCTYDCIYCQLGRTTHRVAGCQPFDFAHGPERAKRVEGLPVVGSQQKPETNPEAVLAEVRAKLAEMVAGCRLPVAGGPTTENRQPTTATRPDYITLSGSGEPTLYARLGELLDGLRQFGIPLAVITNGSLLWRPEVAAACAKADLVSPTLVAGSAKTWQRVNRPHKTISFKKMVEGLVGFRKIFKGRLWLEVMLVAGVNDSDAEVRSIAKLAARVRPDRVQLNTVTRPPADSSAQPVPRERLEALAGLFTPRAEVLEDFPPQRTQRTRRKETAESSFNNSGPPLLSSVFSESSVVKTGDEVLAMIRRHPATAEDVAAGLGLDALTARTHLETLAATGLATAVTSNGRKYWRARPLGG